MSEHLVGFAQQFNVFKAENLLLISRLSGKVEKTLEEDTGATDFSSDLDEILDDCAAEIKSKVGGNAANETSDDDDEQEGAISEAEEWVTDNISNSSMDDRVAAVLWGLGIEEGTARIESLLEKANEVAHVQVVMNVTYRLNGENAQQMKEDLERAIYNAIGRGMLTGDSAATTDSYDVRVKFTDGDGED